MARSYLSLFNLKILSTVILISAACSCAFAAMPTTPITPMKLNLDTQDFLGNPDHQTFQVPILGDTVHLLSYTTNVETAGDQNLYIKVSAVTFYESYSEAPLACSGAYRTLNLSSNSWWNSGKQFGEGNGAGLGTVNLHTAAIDSAAIALGYDLSTGNCVQVQISYRNGDTGTTLGSYVVDTSSGGIPDAPFFLYAYQAQDGEITNAGSANNDVSIISKGNFSVSLGSDNQNTPIIFARVPEGQAAFKITNLGYGSLTGIGAGLSSLFGNSFTNFCSSAELVSGASCNIDYSGNSPGVGAITLTSAEAQQTPVVFPFTVQKPGAVKCWGSNGSGQLGDNSETQRNTPVDVANLGSNFIALTAGSLHTCELKAIGGSGNDGGVKCWGANSFGQLGNGTQTQSNVPVDVVANQDGNPLDGVIEITAGTSHTCALLNTGGVKCWGLNTSGQLGDNSTTMRLTPVNVSGLSSGVVAIAAGNSHTCALLSGGGIKCWGSNSSGQLGNNSTENSSTAVDVSGLSSGVIAITAGGARTCALLSTGGVKCWGNNSSGQLGNGTSINSSIPVDVSNLSSGVIAIEAGTNHTCALLSVGEVKCWGANGSGQLGDGTTTTPRSTPVSVSNLTSAVAITAGGFHTCALLSTGQEQCWGGNSFGQLGDNLIINSANPVNVLVSSNPGFSNLSGVTAITAGNTHTCAVVVTNN